MHSIRAINGFIGYYMSYSGSGSAFDMSKHHSSQSTSGPVRSGPADPDPYADSDADPEQR
jgi:hypothetical protein